MSTKLSPLFRNILMSGVLTRRVKYSKVKKTMVMISTHSMCVLPFILYFWISSTVLRAIAMIERSTKRLESTLKAFARVEEYGSSTMFHRVFLTSPNIMPLKDSSLYFTSISAISSLSTFRLSFTSSTFSSNIIQQQRWVSFRLRPQYVISSSKLMGHISCMTQSNPLV